MRKKLKKINHGKKKKLNLKNKVNIDNRFRGDYFVPLCLCQPQFIKRQKSFLNNGTVNGRKRGREEERKNCIYLVKCFTRHLVYSQKVKTKINIQSHFSDVHTQLRAPGACKHVRVNFPKTYWNNLYEFFVKLHIRAKKESIF